MKQRAEKISIVIPTYNEEDNIFPIYKALLTMFAEHLPEFDYEFVFSDNCSKDSTQQKIEELCKRDKNVKAIFNVRNFGASNSAVNALRNSSGDCAVMFCADFQTPVNVIPQLVEKWRQGNALVCGVKEVNRKDSESISFARTLYYKMISFLADKEFVEDFSGFTLLDKTAVDLVREYRSSNIIVNNVSDLGYKCAYVYYKQEKRAAGKSGNRVSDLYDIFMSTLVSVSKKAVRVIAILGMSLMILTLLFALVYLIVKLCIGGEFPLYKYAILSAIGIFGSLQMLFLGLLGEYVLNVKTKLTKGKLVVEERRINF